MHSACADIDRKCASYIEHLLSVCVARDRDVISGSDARTVIGRHMESRALFLAL